MKILCHNCKKINVFIKFWPPSIEYLPLKNCYRNNLWVQPYQCHGTWVALEYFLVIPMNCCQKKKFLGLKKKVNQSIKPIYSMEETFDRFAALFNITSKPRVILTEHEQPVWKICISDGTCGKVENLTYPWKI